VVFRACRLILWNAVSYTVLATTQINRWLIVSETRSQSGQDARNGKPLFANLSAVQQRLSTAPYEKLHHRGAHGHPNHF
jgi:hypothetical protein